MKLVTWVGQPRQVARSPCVVCGSGRKSRFMAAATAQVGQGVWLWAWGSDENDDFTRENGGVTWIDAIFTLYLHGFTCIYAIFTWIYMDLHYERFFLENCDFSGGHLEFTADHGDFSGENSGIFLPGKRSTHPSGLGSNGCYPLKDAAHFIQKSTNN